MSQVNPRDSTNSAEELGRDPNLLTEDGEGEPADGEETKPEEVPNYKPLTEEDVPLTHDWEALNLRKIDFNCFFGCCCPCVVVWRIADMLGWEDGKTNSYTLIPALWTLALVIATMGGVRLVQDLREYKAGTARLPSDPFTFYFLFFLVLKAFMTYFVLAVHHELADRMRLVKETGSCYDCLLFLFHGYGARQMENTVLNAPIWVLEGPADVETIQKTLKSVAVFTQQDEYLDQKLDNMQQQAYLVQELNIQKRRRSILERTEREEALDAPDGGFGAENAEVQPQVVGSPSLGSPKKKNAKFAGFAEAVDVRDFEVGSEGSGGK